MSISNPTPNSSKTAKPQKLRDSYSSDIPQEGWSWIPLLLAIAVLLPVGLWAWPSMIPNDWIDRDLLIKSSVTIAVIAIGIRINTWLKNKTESRWDAGDSSYSGGSSVKSSSQTQNMQAASMQSKPLTKSYTSVTGKGVVKEVGHYRHEGKIGDDKKSELGMTLKGWGGTEGGSSADGIGRSAMKKPVRK